MSHKVPNTKVKITPAIIADASDSVDFDDSDPFIQRLRRDYPDALSHRRPSSVANSPRRYSDAHKTMQPPSHFYEYDIVSQDTCSSKQTLSVPSKKADKKPASRFSDMDVRGVLERSAAAISSVDETISYLSQLSARNHDIRGSTEMIGRQCDQANDLVNQIQHGMVNND